MRFIISDLESPAGYYFDLFRLQRSEEGKCSWLLNVALGFPDMEEALQSCTLTLNNFQAYAKEMILTNGIGNLSDAMDVSCSGGAFLFRYSSDFLDPTALS